MTSLGFDALDHQDRLVIIGSLYREHHFFGLYKALSSVMVPDLASTRRKLSQFKAHSGISVADTAQEVALSTCTGAVEMKGLRIAESRSLILVVYH